jgi:hypothetical protein
MATVLARARNSRSWGETGESRRAKRGLRWSCRGARHEIWRLLTRDAWRVDDGHAPSARGALPFRDFLLRDAWRLLCGAVRRARDARLPCDGVLLRALTYVAPIG